MKHSDSLKELTASLLAAQANIAHAQKDASNPHMRNSYATIESVIDASKQALLNQGILPMQYVKEMNLVTRLQHKSGEFLEIEVPLLMSKQDMQGLGSAITYARRYSLTSLLNMAQTDDDGNATAKLGKAPRVVTKTDKAPTAVKKDVMPFE